MVVALPEPVLAWRAGGRTLSIDGRPVFVRDQGAGPAVVLIHGFPGSSFDWAGVTGQLPGRVVTLDLPGYGFSDKSPTAAYSLFDQADVVEKVLAELDVPTCTLVAHDMGNTVTAELAARANAGTLGFAIDQIVLTNGSVFIDMAQLTRGQRLTLRLPDRAMPFSLPTMILRRSLLESFTQAAPPPPGALDALIALIQYDHGERLMPRLIRYIEERRAHQEHWTAGFVDFAGPLRLIWGEQDPIAVLAMTERMQRLRPATTVVRVPGVGHWLAIEAPDRLTEELLTLL